MERLRHDFGLEIKNQKGYWLDFENSQNLETFFRFMEIVSTAALMDQTLRDSQSDNLKYVHFDLEGSLNGIGNLKPLLTAIKGSCEIKFVHENFSTGEETAYTAQPYLLKEYQNRWYIFCWVPTYQDFRTFGIDRLQSLVVSDQVFINNKKDPGEIFRQIVGLTYDRSRPVEEVLLSCKPLQARYLRSLPLHHSQEVVLETENEVRLRLRLIPNFELRQQLLMRGDEVTVLKPQYLADEIKSIAKKMLGNYKK